MSASGGAAVEQIPLLHRLDHSLHTYRLWVHAAARHHVGAWRVHEFVEISQRDVIAAVTNLKQLRVRLDTLHCVQPLLHGYATIPYSMDTLISCPCS